MTGRFWKGPGNEYYKAMNKKILILIAFAVALTFIFPGCRASEEIMAFADDAAENYLISINGQDYESYARDLDDTMKRAVPEEEFLDFSSYLKDTIGYYEPGSKEHSYNIVQKGMDVIVYRAGYTDEEGEVEVKIVITGSRDGIYKVSGSWFDSPKLREVKYE